MVREQRPHTGCCSMNVQQPHVSCLGMNVQEGLLEARRDYVVPGRSSSSEPHYLLLRRRHLAQARLLWRALGNCEAQQPSTRVVAQHIAALSSPLQFAHSLFRRQSHFAQIHCG